MPQMKPASIPAFVPLLNAKRVNGICPNEIEKLLPIWIRINDNTIANAATIVPSTQTLFFPIKKLPPLNKKVTKEEAAFENSQTAVYSQFLRSHNRYRYEGFRNRFNLSPIGLPFVSLFIIYFLFQTMD